MRTIISPAKILPLAQNQMTTPSRFVWLLIQTMPAVFVGTSDPTTPWQESPRMFEGVSARSRDRPILAVAVDKRLSQHILMGAASAWSRLNEALTGSRRCRS